MGLVVFELDVHEELVNEVGGASTLGDENGLVGNHHGGRVESCALWCPAALRRHGGSGVVRSSVSCPYFECSEFILGFQPDGRAWLESLCVVFLGLHGESIVAPRTVGSCCGIRVQNETRFSVTVVVVGGECERKVDSATFVADDFAFLFGIDKQCRT